MPTQFPLYEIERGPYRVEQRIAVADVRWYLSLEKVRGDWPSIEKAMMLRGFSGRLIPLDQPQLRINDTLFLSVIFIILMGLFMVSRLPAL